MVHKSDVIDTMNELLDRLMRIDEVEGQTAGFMWADGSVDYHSYEIEHADVLKKMAAGKKAKLGPYIDFSIRGSFMQIRVDHQLSHDEIRRMNDLMTEHGTDYLVVDVWEDPPQGEEYGASRWLELKPVTPSWAARVNAVQRGEK